MTRALALRLEGPLQAWSASRQGDTVPTERFPTLAGVVGLLGAAAGVALGDAVALRDLQGRFHLVVRVDRAGSLLVDYHTVQGIPQREGARVKDTIVTRRGYLEDASFVALLIETASGSLDEVRAFLLAPVFAPCLGRVACSPSQPVLAAPDFFEGAHWTEFAPGIPRAPGADSALYVLDGALGPPQPPLHKVHTRYLCDRLGRVGYVERAVHLAEWPSATAAPPRHPLRVERADAGALPDRRVEPEGGVDTTTGWFDDAPVAPRTRRPAPLDTTTGWFE